MKTNEVAKEVIDVILEGNDPHLIPHLSDEFSRIAAKIKREHTVTIITATSLPEKQKKQIIDELQKIFSKNITNVETVVDKKILGGMKIQIGDTLIDASVRSQLERLKIHLLS